MSEAPKNVFDDVDKLRKAVAEEERKRPRELHEEPVNAQVSYIIDPAHLPREHAILSDLLERLKSKFSLAFDESSLRRLVGRQATVEQLMEHLLSSDADWDFRNGMLRIEQPAPRTTPISQLKITNELIAASVVGSTSEADYVVQRCAEELWRSAGVDDATWGQIKEHAQLRGCKTVTRVDLGVDLIELLSDKFRQFVERDVSGAGGLGATMGKHPVKARLAPTTADALLMVKHVENVRLRVSLFDKVSGISEACALSFSVTATHEFGRGIIVVRSELDSERHTQMITRLLKTLRA